MSVSIIIIILYITPEMTIVTVHGVCFAVSCD